MFLQLWNADNAELATSINMSEDYSQSLQPDSYDYVPLGSELTFPMAGGHIPFLESTGFPITDYKDEREGSRKAS